MDGMNMSPKRKLFAVPSPLGGLSYLRRQKGYPPFLRLVPTFQVSISFVHTLAVVNLDCSPFYCISPTVNFKIVMHFPLSFTFLLFGSIFAMLLSGVIARPAISHKDPNQFHKSLPSILSDLSTESFQKELHSTLSPGDLEFLVQNIHFAADDPTVNSFKHHYVSHTLSEWRYVWTTMLQKSSKQSAVNTRLKLFKLDLKPQIECVSRKLQATSHRRASIHDLLKDPSWAGFLDKSRTTLLPGDECSFTKIIGSQADEILAQLNGLKH
ncbi:hypothetical protein C8Q75DRAFT_786682 [Abortiporus biennis]|nr:hypothetical protein C8Q75DRAFT_786682 [Abortiporus biennis]